MATDLLTLGSVITDLAVSELSEDTSPVLSGNLDGNGLLITNFLSDIKDVVGTSYTFLNEDTGKTVVFDNANAITVTLPDDIVTGWAVSIIQKGAGQVSFSVDGGAALVNVDSHTKISGQYGTAGLSVISNTGGASAEYILAGNTAL